MSKYARFRADDLGKSQILAQNLQISSEESQKIENWFAETLDFHEKLDFFDENEEYLSDSDQKLEEFEQKLIQSYDKLLLEITEKALPYLMTKAIYYYNIFQTNALKDTTRMGTFCGILRGVFWYNHQKISILPKDLVFISDYLRENLEVSPNGDIDENILEIEKKNKISKKWQSAERQAIVKNLLRIIQQKNYHHSLVIFKKVLGFIQKEDVEIQEFVRNFEAENKQGCYQIIHKIFQFPLNADAWQDFSLKMELLQLLDTANGTSPKEAWLKKYALLSEKIGKNALNEMALVISSMENCLYDPITGWKDEVVRRFLKASAWIKEK